MAALLILMDRILDIMGIIPVMPGSISGPAIIPGIMAIGTVDTTVVAMVDITAMADITATVGAIITIKADPLS